MRGGSCSCVGYGMSVEESGASATEDAATSQALSKLFGLAYDRPLDFHLWEQALGETHVSSASRLSPKLRRRKAST